MSGIVRAWRGPRLCCEPGSLRLSIFTNHQPLLPIAIEMKKQGEQQFKNEHELQWQEYEVLWITSYS